jgi:HEAT repeat protein
MFSYAYEEGPTLDERPLREALQHIGTNALPWLLRWAQYEPSQFQRKLARLGRFDYKAVVRAEVAWACFGILGPKADPAIPDLARLANNTNSEKIAFEATMALGEIGVSALPALLVVLTNQQGIARSQAASSIGAIRRLGTNANLAVPVLLNCLKDADEHVAASAAKALGRLGVQPGLVVPALTGYLQYSNEVVRAAVARALGKFGDEAHAAVPSLTRLLSDRFPTVREEATNALRQIAPEALPKEEGN